MNVKWDPEANGVQQFVTGAQREGKAGKGRYDLISPFVLHRLAVLMQVGGEQKGDRNWEQGIPLFSFLDSALRHLMQYSMGMEDEDHLVHALWNIHCLMHTEEMIKLGLLPAELDTLPKYLKGLENGRKEES